MRNRVKIKLIFLLLICGLLNANSCVRDYGEDCPDPPDPPEKIYLVKKISIDVSPDEGETWLHFQDFEYEYDRDYLISQVVNTDYVNNWENTVGVYHYPNLIVLLSDLNSPPNDQNRVDVRLDDDYRIIEKTENSGWSTDKTTKLEYDSEGDVKRIWDVYKDWDDEAGGYIDVVENEMHVVWRDGDIFKIYEVANQQREYLFVHTEKKNKTNLDLNFFMGGSVAEAGLYGVFPGIASNNFIEKANITSFAGAGDSMTAGYEFDDNDNPIVINIREDRLSWGVFLYKYAIEYIVVEIIPE